MANRCKCISTAYDKSKKKTGPKACWMNRVKLETTLFGACIRKLGLRRRQCLAFDLAMRCETFRRSVLKSTNHSPSNTMTFVPHKQTTEQSLLLFPRGSNEEPVAVRETLEAT